MKWAYFSAIRWKMSGDLSGMRERKAAIPDIGKSMVM